MRDVASRPKADARVLVLSAFSNLGGALTLRCSELNS